MADHSDDQNFHQDENNIKLSPEGEVNSGGYIPVSYTHLTLPTKLEV